MKREMLFLSRVLNRSVFLLLFVLIGFSSHSVVAQKLRTTSLAKSTVGSLGLTKREMKPLMPVIQMHTDGLMRIFSKYEDRLENGAVLLSIGPEVWDDLGKYRKKMASMSGGILSRKQLAALHTVYLGMEKEIVTMLLDEESQFLGEDLDLTNEQIDDLYKIVLRDIGRKQLLLNSKLSDDALAQRTKAISADTEARIVRMLFPEQVDAWKKMKSRAAALETKLVA